MSVESVTSGVYLLIIGDGRTGCSVFADGGVGRWYTAWSSSVFESELIS